MISTTKYKDVAIQFAMWNSNNEEKPVIFRILWKGMFGHFRMNSSEYSAYFETENEVLISDGLPMTIHTVNEKW